MQPTSKKQKWILLLSLTLLIPALAYFADKVIEVYSHGYFDLPIFMQAVIGHFRNGEIYRRGEDLIALYKPGAIVYKFPTPYLFPFVPWFDEAGAKVQNFRLVFTWSALLLYASTVFLSIRQCFYCRSDVADIYRSLTFLVWVVIFSCFYVPFFRVLGGTGGENLIIAVAVLAFVSLQRRPWLSGFLFAYLATAKLYPVFLLAYPLLKRQWSVLFFAVVSLFIILAAAIWFFGWEENVFYFKNVLPLLLREPISEDWTEAMNHSTGNFGIVKVLCTYGLLPNRFVIWLNMIRLPMMACLAWLLLSRSRITDGRWYDALCFALVIATMLVSLPNFFYSYLILLIFPIIIMSGFLFDRRKYGWLMLFVVSVSCLLVYDGWLQPIVEQNHILDPVGDMAVVMQQEVSQHGTMYYVFRHFPLAFALFMLGKATQFMTLVIWGSLFAALLSLRKPALTNLESA